MSKPHYVSSSNYMAFSLEESSVAGAFMYLGITMARKLDVRMFPCYLWRVERHLMMQRPSSNGQAQQIKVYEDAPCRVQVSPSQRTCHLATSTQVIYHAPVHAMASHSPTRPVEGIVPQTSMRGRGSPFPLLFTPRYKRSSMFKFPGDGAWCKDKEATAISADTCATQPSRHSLEIPHGLSDTSPACRSHMALLSPEMKCVWMRKSASDAPLQ